MGYAQILATMRATKVVKMTATTKTMALAVGDERGERESIIVFDGGGLPAVQGQREERHRKVGCVRELPPTRHGRLPNANASDTS